jgi:hypothetical protein
MLRIHLLQNLFNLADNARPTQPPMGRVMGLNRLSLKCDWLPCTPHVTAPLPYSRVMISSE